MKTRNTIFKPASMVLTLLIILTVMPFGTTIANAEQVTPGVTVDSTAALADSTLITDNRVRAEEGDSLNTIVIDNGDGTHTMTLYDHPVKFINQDGKTEDISLEITSTDDGAYKNKANNIQTVFPKKISDGISLSGDGVNINLKPTFVTTSLDKRYTKSTVSPITAAVTKIDNETVSYRYDNKTTLEYSLTYTGFKEDIVVSQYTGQTEYKFILETGGLALTKIDESYYLTDTTGEVRATLGDIIIFTADERNNTLGSMTHITVKENQQYILTIHIDAEWLKHENTAYPIRIDPTIEITYDNNGANAIQDVTINSTAGSSGSSGSIYVGYRSNYGISRTLMKFPGLNLDNIVAASNITSAYVQIRDIMCETTSMEVYGYIFAGNDWSESTATWSNVSPNSWTEMPNAYAYVSYSSGNALNPKHRYSIDITTAVKSWKTGFYSQSKGIMLRAHDSVEHGDSYLYKTFASYNRASNKPSLVVNYNSYPSSETVGITSGKYYYIQNDYSGLHLDIYNSNQTYGTNLIQFSLTGTQNQRFQLLYIGNGEYEIKPAHVQGMNLTANSSGSVFIAEDNNLNSQRWYIYLFNSYYFFINKEYNTKKLSVNGSTTNATPVTLSNNSGFYWYIGGSDKSVSMASYNAGVRLTKLNGLYIYNYTTPINNLLSSAVTLCEEHRCMSYDQYCEYMYQHFLSPTFAGHLGTQISSFEWFYNQVNHGRVWDVKLQNRWEQAMPNVTYLGQSVEFLFREHVIDAEDLGNIMYGYTGRATGFGDITLYWGGGVAKQGSLNNAAVNTPPLYGDDENDHKNIELGYNLFCSDYPNYPDVGYNGIPVEPGILAAIADLLLDPGT